MTKLMTLAEALATGRPFKHKDWEHFTESGTRFVVVSAAYEPVWEVQEEEKPPMRVYLDELGYFVVTSQQKINGEWDDITESLADALAPYLKEKGE